jgi:hypothetical protein
MEVIVVEEASYLVCEQLSLGERVRGGSENSWKESCSCHKARKLLVGLLLKPKGREVSSRWTVLVTVKVYTPRVGQTCGE